MSVTTGVSRCGIPSYKISSTLLGSIKINLTSWGVALKRIENKILWMKTDLPDPVVPAISKWGIFPIS